VGGAGDAAAGQTIVRSARRARNSARIASFCALYPREVDLAAERYRLARPGVEQAVRAWREAVAQLPQDLETTSMNGDGLS
jgi:hypothetical protein